MRFPLHLSLTWIGTISALSLPERSADRSFSDTSSHDSGVVARQARTNGRIPRQFIEKGCDAGKKDMIRKAWEEAQELADAQTNYRIGYNYDIPHTQWLGKDWNSERAGYFFWRYNFRKLIGDNFSRLRKLFSEDAPSGEYIYLYCNDYDNICNTEPNMQAYSWDRLGAFWSNHYTAFCPPFYDRLTLTEQISLHENDKHNQKIMENFQMNRGLIMFHELWHYEQLVTSPRALDYGYQAKRSWNLAKDDGTFKAYINADSYALDAVAIFVQQHYKSAMSPVPFEYLHLFDPKAANVATPPKTIEGTTKALDQPPPGWKSPESETPDPEMWEELFPDSADGSTSTGAADNNLCHGIGGDYWIMSRDLAVDNAQDFCNQEDNTKKYNLGSVNELELSAKKISDGALGPKDAPECIDRFRNAVIDGCDGADPVNNPHNYKFGSTLTTRDGWEFKLTPLSKQVNEVSCDVSYKFFFDSFEIRGKNLPDAKLGAQGEGLRKELSGCGALTKWNFERTPDDCCFQWYATGQLPIGTKDCVGRAVMSAGGSGKGNCHGPGKREQRGDSINRWPGYGDESKHVFKKPALLYNDTVIE